MAKRSASVSAKNQRVHVISRKDGWAVQKEGNSKVFDRKEAAVEGARKLSKGHSDVIVHKKDGSIQRWERSESNS